MLISIVKRSALYGTQVGYDVQTENAGHEFAGHEIAGNEIARHDKYRDRT